MFKKRRIKSKNWMSVLSPCVRSDVRLLFIKNETVFHVCLCVSIAEVMNSRPPSVETCHFLLDDPRRHQTAVIIKPQQDF